MHSGLIEIGWFQTFKMTSENFKKMKLQRAGHIAFVYGDQLVIWAGYSVSF